MEDSLLIQHTVHPLFKDPNQDTLPLSQINVILWPHAATELFLEMTIFLHKPKQYRNIRENIFGSEWTGICTNSWEIKPWKVKPWEATDYMKSLAVTSMKN